MDLVSLETSDENEWIKSRIVQDKVSRKGANTKQVDSMIISKQIPKMLRAMQCSADSRKFSG